MQYYSGTKSFWIFTLFYPDATRNQAIAMKPKVDYTECAIVIIALMR